MARREYAAGEAHTLAAERIVFALLWRCPNPVFGVIRNASQIWMALEPDAEHIEDLALRKRGAGIDGDNARRNAVLFRNAYLDENPVVLTVRFAVTLIGHGIEICKQPQTGSPAFYPDSPLRNTPQQKLY